MSYSLPYMNFIWPLSRLVPDSSWFVQVGGWKHRKVVLVLLLLVLVHSVMFAKDSRRCCSTVVKPKYLQKKKSSVLSRTVGEYAPSCLQSHRNCSSTQDRTQPAKNSRQLMDLIKISKTGKN